MVGSTSKMNTVDQLRKIRKPMVEKMRRDRMNRSVDRLKEMLTDSGVNGTCTKLDKADVLDLTVSHLRHLQTRRPSPAVSVRTTEYVDGFTECTREIVQYLIRSGAITPQSLNHLRNHLAIQYANSIGNKAATGHDVKQTPENRRASTPDVEPHPPQFCSTPVQGLHGVPTSSVGHAMDISSDISAVHACPSRLDHSSGSLSYSGRSSCLSSSGGSHFTSSTSSAFSVVPSSPSEFVSRYPCGTSHSASTAPLYGISHVSSSFTDLSSEASHWNKQTTDSRDSGVVLNTFAQEDKLWRPW